MRHGDEIRWRTFSFDMMKRRGWAGVEVSPSPTPNFQAKFVISIDVSRYIPEYSVLLVHKECETL
jgi:hypothetical protein